MRSYLVSRAAQGVLTVVAVLLINFVLVRTAPGDPAVIYAGIEATPQYIESIRIKFGLSRPLYEQFAIYFGTLVTGDLGYSFFFSRPVIEVIINFLQPTLILTAIAFVLEVLIGVGLGVLSAKRPYSKLDSTITIVTLFAYSMPEFWVALLIALLVAFYIPIFPLEGMMTLGQQLSGIDLVQDRLAHLALPVFVLGLYGMAVYARMTRASMLEILREDYIMTARSKGCTENAVLYKHALRNALLPVITLMGLRLRHIFTGALFVETIFNWPGIGRVISQSLFQRDYPLITGIFLIVTILTVAGNLLADIAYAAADPRIRY